MTDIEWEAVGLYKGVALRFVTKIFSLIHNFQSAYHSFRLMLKALVYL